MNKLVCDLMNITHSYRDIHINHENLHYECVRFHNTFKLGENEERDLYRFASSYMYNIIKVLTNTYKKENQISLILLDKIDETSSINEYFIFTIKDRLVTYLSSLS